MASLKITLKKSLIGRIPKHRSIIECLGLRRINHSVVKNDSPIIRGMINKVHYLLMVEEID